MSQYLQGWHYAGLMRGDSLKKLTINLDTVALIAILLALSMGMNAWQRYQFNDLMSEYLDGQWEAQDVKANLVFARTQLKQCDPVKYADLDVNP
jgi:hypothetical protein